MNRKLFTIKNEQFRKLFLKQKLQNKFSNPNFYKTNKIQLKQKLSQLLKQQQTQEQIRNYDYIGLENQLKQVKRKKRKLKFKQIKVNKKIDAIGQIKSQAGKKLYQMWIQQKGLPKLWELGQKVWNKSNENEQLQKKAGQQMIEDQYIKQQYFFRSKQSVYICEQITDNLNQLVSDLQILQI